MYIVHVFILYCFAWHPIVLFIVLLYLVAALFLHVKKYISQEIWYNKVSHRYKSIKLQTRINVENKYIRY